MTIKSYVITHDYGFAPNPYGGFLTLATCKPKIRNSANIGDILFATGSTNSPYKDKIIYVGIIDKIIDMNEYFYGAEYECKKPKNNTPMTRRGDNLYYQENDKWKQLSSDYHDIDAMEHDLKSKNVLICQDFWYFGNKAIAVPDNLIDVIHYGRGHKNIDDPIFISEFLEWINAFEKGLIGRPSSL